jgi:geranyl-CoA carboxylase beta subunit
MPVIVSRISPQPETFKANTAQMLAQLEEVRALEQAVIAHSARSADKFEKRGQILPRERVARLLDRGAPFLELSTLAGWRMHDDDGETKVTGGGLITGIGVVSGKRVLVSANDSAIKGGTISPMALRKVLRAQEIARENKLPIISLVESGGANLLYQSEMFVEGGRCFANQARLSAAGIPQIAVVHGSSTAGGAYLPGLSDYVILVKDQSKIFLAGPPLVKAAIGEDASDEELGGAGMHAEITGLGEFVAQDDVHAIALARELIAKLKWDPVRKREHAAVPPKYGEEELMGIVPVSGREPYDVREIIARIVDGSGFLDFKRDYGAETVCGYGAIGGFEVGILGNNGAIQPDGSAKAAQFIQLCDQSGTPLVFLQNTTGYMVGRQAERGGAIKHGSKMIQAVANARVPKFTVIVGGSYGAGNYGMCGRGFDPRFIFSWPNARIAVMGGPQAAKVMEIVTRAKFEKSGGASEPVLKQMSEAIERQLDRESTALYATARLWDDGIIDPRDTRKVLSLCLAIAAEADARALRPNTFGVARL